MKKIGEIAIPNYRSKRDLLYVDYKTFCDGAEAIDVSDSSALVLLILRSFYSISKKTALTLNAKQITILVDNVNKAIKEDSGGLDSIITFEGKRYGFLNFEEITLGALFDLDRCYKDNDMISLMSICYRPLKGKLTKAGYEIEEYIGYNSETFARIDLKTVQSVSTFFTKSFQILKNYTATSLEESK